jgi:NADH-quinone oxidoreductase subunit J
MTGVPLPEAITFFACALIVLGGAFGVIWFRNPVQAALSLVATLFGVAVLFLNMDAPFLAAVQVIVYTGAIVVLILFVMMLLGVDREEDIDEEPLAGQRVIAFVLAAGVAGLVVAGVLAAGPDLLSGEPAATAAITDEPNIVQIGRLLFTEYVFAFEITAVLLTIAVVAAVVLSRRPRDLEPLPEPASMEPPEAEVPADEEVVD